MKVGTKRRKCREEIVAEKLELEVRNEALASKDERLLEMANMLREKQEECEVNASAAKCLSEMVEAGVVARDA